MFGFMDSSALEVAVLDASKYDLSLARLMLSQIGIRQTRVYDQPFRALDELMLHPCSLFIIDSKLPEDISGLRLVRCLRSPELAPLCFTPMIVTTRRPTHRFVEAAVRCGSNFVIAKPYSSQVLQQRIDRVMAGATKFELQDSHYVNAEVIGSFEARAPRVDPALALLIASSPSPVSSLAPHTGLTRQTLINMLRSSDLKGDI